MLIGAPKTRELIDVRHGLEVQAARLAAAAIEEEDLETLTGYVAEMESHKPDFARFVAADMMFHQAIATAADNTLLSETLQTVRSLIRVWVERALKDTSHAQLTCNEHRAILAALSARDSGLAAAAMSTHMDSAAARLGPTLTQEVD